MFRFGCIAAALLASTAFAVDPYLDPTAMNIARRTAAADSRAVAAASTANQNLATLGLSSAQDAITAISAYTDDQGNVHARLQQRTHRLRVVGAGVISHQAPTGLQLPYTIFTLPGITTTSTPVHSNTEAFTTIGQDPHHTQPFVGNPISELVYFPVTRRVVIATGQPVPPPTWDQTAVNPIPEDLQTDQVAKVVTRVALAWELIAPEGDSVARSYTTQRWWVDAISNTVLGVEDADGESTGSGVRRWTGTNVTFSTTPDGSCFRTHDSVRKFKTEDEDVSGAPVSCDSDDVFGNGLSFLTDATATAANRQTALVDVHFGATVYWDLLSNVFGMQGPDDNFYSVNAFVHAGTDWDNSKYYSLSGNTAFGDGNLNSSGTGHPNERTKLDCVGHEMGHGFNDFNSHFGGVTQCLNESMADVYGELTKAYLNSGGFASHAATVGNSTTNDWFNACSGRNMITPSANSHPSLWYAGIEDLEPHAGSGPASRAFVFLSDGSSAFMDAVNYSPKLPWGMRGAGLDAASRIFELGLKAFVNAGNGYAGERTGLGDAASLKFGSSSSQLNAVRNAFAGINVGSKQPGYPAEPSPLAEIEPNDTMGTAQVVTFPNNPSGVVVTAPKKQKISAGTGTSADVYRVDVPAGKKMVARVTQNSPLSFATLKVYDTIQTYDSANVNLASALVKISSAACFGAPICTYFVEVDPIISFSGYVIDFDLQK